ncbi:SANT/Myb_domain [Hexamita inflata]|uniref:SANT/Myb domain n=1 Tax=Hexamita inflata TaxID=28002 RepID=A0AA86V3L3_9EUKA|nr:SANT/Myb domain [Hexamita inflata]CAI9974905.1 SANT/Myb domain [Hexamita inflata]CAI9974907.1 SANT/Myb domain [Hexamita inflata]
MKNQVNTLLNMFENFLQTEPQQVLFEVMMLPDNMYTYLFAQVSAQMNVAVSQLKCQFSAVVNENFHIKCQHSTTPSYDSCLKQKTVKQQYEEQKLQFAQKLGQVLAENKVSATVSDHKLLCSQVDSCIQECGQKKFWKSMQSRMPDKTVKQVRDYYHRSFQQVLYNCQISYEDKQVLQKLMAASPQERPTDIATHFLEICSNEVKNYSRRNIVVYIVNARRQ